MKITNELGSCDWSRQAAAIIERERTTPLKDAELEQVRTRHAAASGAPWQSQESDDAWTLHSGMAQILKAPKHGTPYAEYWPEAADAAFLTCAHRDVTKLLATVDEQRRTIDRLRALVADEHSRLSREMDE